MNDVNSVVNAKVCKIRPYFWNESEQIHGWFKTSSEEHCWSAIFPASEQKSLLNESQVENETRILTAGLHSSSTAQDLDPKLQPSESRLNSSERVWKWSTAIMRSQFWIWDTTEPETEKKKR